MSKEKFRFFCYEGSDFFRVHLKKWVNDGKLSWDFNFGIPSTLDVETILVVTLGPLVGKEEFEAQSRQKVKKSRGRLFKIFLYMLGMKPRMYLVEASF